MAYRDSTSNSASAASSVVVTAPAGIQNDDILIAVVQWGGNEDQTITWPSGFTQLTTSNGANNASTFATAWKRASSESGNYTIQAQATDFGAAAISVYSGRHTTNAPVAATPSVDNTQTASPRSCPTTGITAVEGDDIVYCLCQVDGSADWAHTPPTNYTEREEVGPGSWVDVSLSDRENVSAGATGTLTGTLTLADSSTGFIGVTIRIPLAVAATTPPIAPCIVTH